MDDVVPEHIPQHVPMGHPELRDLMNRVPTDDEIPRLRELVVSMMVRADHDPGILTPVLATLRNMSQHGRQKFFSEAPFACNFSSAMAKPSSIMEFLSIAFNSSGQTAASLGWCLCFENLSVLRWFINEVMVMRDNLLHRFFGTDFECSVCRDLFTVPTTLLCGHTLCHQCIRLAHCPLCRTLITEIPKANVELNFICEKLRATDREQHIPVSPNQSFSPIVYLQIIQTELREPYVLGAQRILSKRFARTITEMDVILMLNVLFSREHPNDLLFLDLVLSEASVSINTETLLFHSLQWSRTSRYHDGIFADVMKTLQARCQITANMIHVLNHIFYSKPLL
ncbi:hypothetical protein HK102_003344 [Quaeritorhiza haematococci]|nr:hypothetical protein HK102_003344 [Quaeritorhiza haematococci]